MSLETSANLNVISVSCAFQTSFWMWPLIGWLCLSAFGLPSRVTGALSSEEAFPPVAGAALHPGTDDPGHVYPHITFTGQFSQH